MKKKSICTALFLLSFGISYAQEEDKLGAWYVYNGFLNFSPKFELFLESQWRTYEPISNTENWFFRTYFNYNLTENFQLGLGQEYHLNWSYAEEPDDKIKSEEYRTTLQAMLFHKIDRVSIQHRYRYEFRFLDQKGNQRTRYRIQLSIPLTGPTVEKGNIFSTVGNEIMVNTRKEVNLSQMRSYVMLGYQITKATNIQAGYMYITRPSEAGLHRLQFFFTQKLYFFEK